MGKTLKHTILFLLFFLCHTVSDATAADGYEADDKALLLKLDRMIAQREVYRQKIEKRIGDLQQKLEYVEDDKSRFELLGELFTTYRSYRIDTALIIAKERLRLAEVMEDEHLVNQGLMNLADAMNKMNCHDRALATLSRVKRSKETERDTYFYYLYHTTYLSCHNDETDPERKRHFWQMIKNYKDTLVSISDPASTGYITNKCGRLSMSGQWEEAFQLLEAYYRQCPEDNPDKARVEYLLAELCQGRQDFRGARHYLIKASITDIANAKKVYMSLQQLAMMLFHEGDIERAYNYISCSLEDVTFGKARYRIVDIAEYMPIIKAGNDARVLTNRKRMYAFFFLLSLLLVTLLAAFFFIRKKNRKLVQVKQSLAVQNLRLQETTDNLKRTNQELKESDRIKEEYIGLLFNICSEYIYQQENERKALLKVTKTGTMADISKLLHSRSSTTEDFKLFIRKFDTIFLSIFPDFVKSFNQLLRDDEQVVLKEGELLTPELRIYALIRLGINDNSKIANFLHYSLQTVYNYRMKMRNKARTPGKEPILQLQ